MQGKEMWIGAAACALALLAGAASQKVASGPAGRTPDAQFAIGAFIDVPEAYTPHTTALIATRSTCRFCSRSMPFYRSLAGLSVLWVAAGENAAVNRRYLEGNGIRPNVVLEHSDAGLNNLDATPTVIVVNSDRRVVGAWRGLLSVREQDEVRRLLTSRRE